MWHSDGSEDHEINIKGLDDQVAEDEDGVCIAEDSFADDDCEEDPFIDDIQFRQLVFTLKLIIVKYFLHACFLIQKVYITVIIKLKQIEYL